jgi:hypothetical protein
MESQLGMAPLLRGTGSGVLSAWIWWRERIPRGRKVGRRGGTSGSAFSALTEDNPASRFGDALNFLCSRSYNEDSEAWCTDLAIVDRFNLLT